MSIKTTKQISMVILVILLVFFVTGCGKGRPVIIKKTVMTGNINVEYPQISKLGDEALQTWINSQLYAKAFELRETIGMNMEESKASYFSRYDVTLEKRDILSIRFAQTYSGPGGTRPVYRITAITLNIKSGSEYELRDVFKSEADYRSVLNGLISRKMDSSGKKLLKEFKGIGRDQGFYLTEDSLAVFYQPGEYTSHSEGPLSVLINYSDISDILKLKI